MRALNLFVYTFFMLVLLCVLGGCTSHNKQGHGRKRQKSRQLFLLEKSPRKPVRDMTVEEAIRAGEFYEHIKNYDLLIATYQHIITKSQHQPEIAATYHIKLADLHLSSSDWNEAKKYYKKVIALYPGYTNIERARYREVIAHFWSSLNPERDQSTTYATIQLGKAYLKDFSMIADACERITSMITASYRKLLEADIKVTEAYLQKYLLNTQNEKPLLGAVQRLATICTELLPDMQRFLPEVAAIITTVALPASTTTYDTLEARTALATLIYKKLDILRQELIIPGQQSALLTAAHLRDRF